MSLPERCANLAAMAVFPGMTIGERFWLEAELGRGGMGSVWKARHLSLQCWCALKFIEGANAADPRVRERFWREAHAAAQVRSPHIVQVWDFGEWQGIPYLVMEYLEGQSLRARLDRVGRLSPQACVLLLQQAGRGLTRAHNAGMIHRDLKPSNLFLCHDDDREVMKIIDFGIVKHVGPSAEQLDKLTKTDAVLGTIHYLSPEQAQGSKSIDHRSDVWALAVIAFECLVGRKPFQGGTVGELLIQLMISPLPMPTKLASDLPPALDTWWEKAAARDVTKRYGSVKEMIDGLAQALGIPVNDPLALNGDGAASSAVPPPPVLVVPSALLDASSSNRDQETRTSVSAGSAAGSLAGSSAGSSAGASSSSAITGVRAVGGAGTSRVRLGVGVAVVIGVLTLGGGVLASRVGLLGGKTAIRSASGDVTATNGAKADEAAQAGTSAPSSAPAVTAVTAGTGAEAATAEGVTPPTGADPKGTPDGKPATPEVVKTGSPEAPTAEGKTSKTEAKPEGKAGQASTAKPPVKGKAKDDEYGGF